MLLPLPRKMVVLPSKDSTSMTPPAETVPELETVTGMETLARAGGDRDGAGARRGGSKEAVLIHRADVAGDLPGEGFRIRLQGDVVVGGGGGQLGGGAGGGIQRGERGAAAVPGSPRPWDPRWRRRW